MIFMENVDSYLSPISLTCPNCGYVWVFTGNCLNRTTCPCCKGGVTLKVCATEEAYEQRLEEFCELITYMREEGLYE